MRRVLLGIPAFPLVHRPTADRDLDKLILQRQTAPESFKSAFIGHGRLRRFQPCAFHLIVVAVQHLPVGIQKLYLALAGRKLVP